MQRVIDIGLGLLGQVLAPGRSIFWLYLLSAATIAFAVYWHRRGPRRSFRGALRFLFAPRVWLHRSVLHDLALFVINALLHSFLFLGPLQALTTSVAHGVWTGLNGGLGPLAAPHGGPLAIGLMTITVFLVADLAFFTSHVLLHKIPWLWPFHAVHHSAPVLVPLTVFRRHPVDVVFESSVSGVMLGVAYGVFGYLGGGALAPSTILGINALLFVALLAGFNLQHSHVWLSFGRLDRIFISPATHQIHHSMDAAHVDRNFGNMLAIWDLAAGTLVRPRRDQRIQFGLRGSEHDAYRSLLALCVRPFVRALRRRR